MEEVGLPGNARIIEAQNVRTEFRGTQWASDMITTSTSMRGS
jgi:hypothetical protein